VPGTIEREPEARRVTFTMADDKERERQIRVAYNSSITPDTFKDEAEVLVEGTFLSDGTFEADTLFAKCPSKYESKGYPESGQAGLPEPTS
jgi:cytochrome c-type biogenesis protein CcmE